MSIERQRWDDWSANNPKKTRFKSIFLLTAGIIFAFMESKGQAQQVFTIEMSNQTNGQLGGDQSLSTIYDGVTPESYISYLQLDGTQASVKTIIQDLDTLNQPRDYTVMLWFKPQSGEAWGKQYQYAFEFESSLQCYFTAQASLMCDSMRNSDKLIANGLTLGVNLNEWAHLSVTGKVNSVSRLLVQTNTKGVVSEDQKSYLSFQQTKRPFSVCLGGCNNEFNFIGGLRDFLVLSRSISKDQALILKNQFLSWDSQVLAYYRFTESTFLKDFYRMNKVDIVTQNGTAAALSKTYGRDYTRNDICSPLFETKLFHEFTQTYEVPTVGIDMRWTPKNTGWEYSVSMWVLIRQDSCSQANPRDSNNQCYFVSLNDAFIVYQPQPNQVAIFFQNDKIFNQLTSKKAFVPHNQWINIQITMNQYNGYQIKVYDLLGKLISSTEEARDLQSQNVRRKEISIFRGYRGLVKAFTLLTERVALPYNLFPTNQVTVKNSCIAQLHFTEELMKDVSRVTNFCQHQRLGSLSFKMAVPANFVGEQNANFPTYQSINQKSQLSVNEFYNQTLFDGIACNDGYQSSTFKSRNSYYKTQTKLQPNQTFNAGTVEFWFKTPTVIAQTTFLFQVFTNQTQDEFLTIYFEAQFHSALICAPMGRDLIASAFAVYDDYRNLTENQWLHISCSFDQDAVNATLFQQDTIASKEFAYSVVRPNKYVAKNDTLVVYIGNSRLLTQGLAGLVVKEVRMWNYKRSLQEIREWRYNQIDPRSLVTKGNSYPLITYIRFTEANYKEFNFASIIPQSGANAQVSFKDIDILSQPGLTLCPLATQYDQERMLCFADPIQKLSLAVYPIVQTSASGIKSLDWIFDASETQFVNSIVKHQVRFFWDFVDDPIAQRYIQRQNLTSQSKIIIPSTIFRDENYYQVKLNVSNLDLTQSKVKQIKFVPINCQYYVINQQDTIFVNNYTSLRSSEDISFTVDFQTLTSYCAETTFFNQLSPDQFVFDVSPQLKLKPYLRVQSISSTQVRITIPKEEQFKFDSPSNLPNRNGFKIIVGVKLTNKVYTANVETKELTFQNVIYNIRFLNDVSGSLQGGQSIEETLQPRVKLINGDSIVLRGENAILDASETFVSGRSIANQRDGLSFTWVCPIDMLAICQGRNGTQLNITERQEFIFFLQFFKANSRVQAGSMIKNIHLLLVLNGLRRVESQKHLEH